MFWLLDGERWLCFDQNDVWAESSLRHIIGHPF
jgi:hypothetical protein